MQAIESGLRSRFEAERRESKKLRKAALGSLRDDLRDQIAKRLKKTRRQLDQSLGTRLDTEATRLSAEIDERAAAIERDLLSRFASLRPGRRGGPLGCAHRHAASSFRRPLRGPMTARSRRGARAWRFR